MRVIIKYMYWSLGHYDKVCVFEAPNDETAASVLLAADILGNIRTQTMRAFTSSEMKMILDKAPLTGGGREGCEYSAARQRLLFQLVLHLNMKTKFSTVALAALL